MAKKASKQRNSLQVYSQQKKHYPLPGSGKIEMCLIFIGKIE
jgi:hypothetical protein